jgi:hypothetical protein
LGSALGPLNTPMIPRHIQLIKVPLFFAEPSAALKDQHDDRLKKV